MSPDEEAEEVTDSPKTAVRLTQRQVQALWRQAYLTNTAGGLFTAASDSDILSHDEMIDLEARLYVAAHPELVQHVIELDVER